MQNPQIIRWHLYGTGSELVERATGTILRVADEAIAARGEFLIVLAGGTTPKQIYERLADAPADWARWKIYFGDERCLDADHPDRNSAMASAAWLDRARPSAAEVFPIPAELGPDAGAAAYRDLLHGVGTFDVVLLGLGEDGHTASLFPGRDWGRRDEDLSVLPVLRAPKPPPERISLSAARLSHARQVLVFVTGEAKADAVSGWRADENLPITAVRPVGGVDAMLTVDAWS